MLAQPLALDAAARDPVSDPAGRQGATTVIEGLIGMQFVRAAARSA
jgi:hypothetical protein